MCFSRLAERERRPPVGDDERSLVRNTCFEHCGSTRLLTPLRLQQVLAPLRLQHEPLRFLIFNPQVQTLREFVFRL